MSSTMDVTNLSSFNELLGEHKYVMADFWASWCVGCVKFLREHMDFIVNRYPDLQVIKVNVDAASKLVDKFGITHVPCFVFFKEGEPHARVEGNDIASVIEAIENLLANE